MYKLRDYQQEAVNIAIDWVKSTIDPGLIEAFTAAGKSIIVAEIAKTISKMTGKKILVLQPNKELLTQNAAKFALTGEPYSIFSASKGQKSLKHNVVFGTALTVKNYLDRFCNKFCMVILDEADASLTPTIIDIINHLREQNPKLRVLGLTSSPYRLGKGYIYKIDINDKPVPEDKAVRPFFTKRIVHISGRSLLEQGFISPVVIGAINTGGYDTGALEINSMGKFTSESVDRAFTGQGRKTSQIIADVVAQSANRKSVLIFAATQKHAAECLASLPSGLSAMVTDKTTPADRDRIVKNFTSCKLKYLVNQNIFTRGSDFPMLDTIALLRATESSALLHQIIGRGVRIAPDKTDCLLLDYAGNLDNHHPDGDLFNPVIKVWNAKTESQPLTAICPQCETENQFSARKNEDGFKINENGYYVDLDGNQIMTEFGAMPAHYGRRCLGMQLIAGKYEQCTFRWTFKPCPECNAENDIAARYCSACKCELIDPNEKLIADFKARKKDPYAINCDEVIDWSLRKTIAKSGAECLVVDYVTTHRKFPIWYQIRSGHAFAIKLYESFLNATNGGEYMPKTITYRKEQSGFYKVLAYNQPADKLELSA